MKQIDFQMTAQDGQSIAVYHWGSGRPPRALIILSHGMGEHARRYPPALERLIETGIDVYALDHRGHGATARNAAQLGDLGTGGFAALAGDLVALTRIAKDANPGLPVVLLGHSLGSMVAQLFAVEHSDLIDALALSGTAAVDQVAVAARDPQVFTRLNASFEPARTPFDWLSRDEREVDVYIADPLCGFALQPESFGSLLSYGEYLASPLQLARIRRDLPVYVFCGEHDPLNRDLNALQSVIDRYRSAGLSVVAQIYPGARHEILNEINRAQVVGALGDWINTTIAAHPGI